MVFNLPSTQGVKRVVAGAAAGLLLAAALPMGMARAETPTASDCAFLSAS